MKQKLITMLILASMLFSKGCLWEKTQETPANHNNAVVNGVVNFRNFRPPSGTKAPEQAEKFTVLRRNGFISSELP